MNSDSTAGSPAPKWGTYTIFNHAQLGHLIERKKPGASSASVETRIAESPWCSDRNNADMKQHTNENHD